MAVLSRHVAGASASRITHMAAWWNTWTHLQDVRFDYETEPKPRPVRLSGPSIVIGQPVRIGVSGVEVEAVIAAVDRGVLTAALKRLTLIRAATPPAAASSRSRGLLLGRPARARHLETCRFFQRRTDHLVRTRRAGYVGRNWSQARSSRRETPQRGRLVYRPSQLARSSAFGCEPSAPSKCRRRLNPPGRGTGYLKCTRWTRCCSSRLRQSGRQESRVVAVDWNQPYSDTGLECDRAGCRPDRPLLPTAASAWWFFGEPRRTGNPRSGHCRHRNRRLNLACAGRGSCRKLADSHQRECWSYRSRRRAERRASPATAPMSKSAQKQMTPRRARWRPPRYSRFSASPFTPPSAKRLPPQSVVAELPHMSALCVHALAVARKSESERTCVWETGRSQLTYRATDTVDFDRCEATFARPKGSGTLQGLRIQQLQSVSQSEHAIQWRPIHVGTDMVYGPRSDVAA